ncbi:MAG: alpha-L-rhamnosidase C-terminal domain-containing protein, partial [Flavobacteriales bacterium]|nr:alpha-L-rhamnosidase C-terminal domain-containing protein [Flavobacteriales bacterium]
TALGCLFCLSAYSQDKNAPWKGEWISADQCQSATNTWLIYRTTKRLYEKPQSMIARIAADSKYWLWINGKMVVFEGGLKRGPAPGKTYYDQIDIAPYLQKGDNTIAILLWHFGKNGFSHANSGRAALLFDAQSPQGNILSDTSWGCDIYKAYQNTEAPFPNYRLPESNIRFDAREAINGWYLPSYKKEMTVAVPAGKADGAPFGKLVPRPIPQWKDYGLSAYKDTTRHGDTLICTLNYNCHATPYIKLDAQNAADTIRIMTDNYNGGSEKNVRAEYITVKGVQEYENLGWMNGHHVWYILPKGVKVLDVKYRETGYDAEFSGSFTCNDEFLNELWKRSARTLYVTMRDTYMDCPDRERAQWWGDAVNELGEAFYALSPSAQLLAKKGIYELMNWQRDNGTIYSPVPSGNWTRELPLQMLASVGWYGFYTQYYYSGDSTWVKELYPRIHRYLHSVWRTDEKGMPVQRKGDWSWGDWGKDIDMDVLTTCWYYLALKAEKEFAIIADKTTDADEITAMMKKIEQNFDSQYWTGFVYRSKGHVGADDDRAQAMAVVSGLAHPDHFHSLIDALKKEYHASPYMEKYVLEALYMLGEDTFAIERMHKRYAKMMAYKDFTTLFEGWGIGAEGFGGGTTNHAWSGGPLTLLSQKVCGITPTSPAFKTFKVQPQMGSLTQAQGKIVTANGGEIAVSVTVKGKNTTVKVNVPNGSTATVILPNGKTKTVGSGYHTVK